MLFCLRPHEGKAGVSKLRFVIAANTWHHIETKPKLPHRKFYGLHRQKAAVTQPRHQSAQTCRCRRLANVAIARFRLTNTPEKMTNITLSTEDQTMLMKALQSKSADVLQARMANALLLLSDGLPVEDVAGLLYVSEEVVAGWQKIFAKRASRAA